MASKYNDIIKKRGGKAAYSIEEEKGDQWESFIPNEQFNGVLRTVLRAVKGNDIDSHKSFWIEGTYGTGKSHAVAVVTHLLCDPVDTIKHWVNSEYGDEKFKIIRDQIFKLRQEKRLLPVKIEGLRDMSHVTDLPLVIQTAVVKSLKNHGIESFVDTDFDALINHIKENKVIWDDLISRFPQLSSVAPSRDVLISKLVGKDMGTFQKARIALRGANINIRLSQENIGSWLVEVQEKIRAEYDYKGLLIIWDEFTDVMADSLGISVLKALQTIVQKFANEENDSFFFLISHPSAFDKLGIEERKQTDGRYHRMKYNMESVSAFRIMSRKFEIIDRERHESMRNYFYTLNGELLDIYTRSSNDPQETRSDLLNLFPIHPATANLATHYATVVGSSSRSVFEFIGQNTQMEEFLNSEEAFNNRLTVTADYLWDFVLKVFQDDVTNYGAVTERFSNYRMHVANHSDAAFAAFKGILLLNAFNNISGENNNNLVTPSEENIFKLFAGTQYAEELPDVLKWFNDEGIIQRTPTGIYSVQFTALPSKEIENLKETLANDSKQFKFVSSILRFADTSKKAFEKSLKKAKRPLTFEFFSEATNDSILKDSIKRSKRDARTSNVYLALLFGKTHAEVAHLRQFAQEATLAAQESDKELRDIAFIVFDAPFGEKEYTRFIEYMANYTVAQQHGLIEQVNVHRHHAIEMIEDWLTTAQRQNATIYVNGEERAISAKKMTSEINDFVAPFIFPAGPDAVRILREKAPQPFWNPQVSKDIITRVMSATSKGDISAMANPRNHIQYLIQDCLDDNLQWKPDAPANHPFKMVFDFIQNRIKYADKSMLFNFVDKFDDLVKPPYGLSGNFASAAMMAFAMRGWEGKIFDTLGKPLEQARLMEAVTELFRVWENGKTTSKLSFKFQTPEEGKLCRALVRTLKLDKLKGYSDVTSLKDARFAITMLFIEQKGFPLWALKYMDEEFCNTHPAITMNDDMRRLFDNIMAICKEQDVRNIVLVKDTLELLDRFRADIPDILNKPGSFKNGFKNFLFRQDDVRLEEEEFENAYDYIKKHLESTIGYWTEEEVAKALMSWRIAEREAIEEERRRREKEQQEAAERERQEKIAEELRRLEEEAKKAKDKAYQSLKGDPQVMAKKRVSAREYIDSIQSADALREIIDKIMNLGYEFVIDKILEDTPYQE